MSDSSKTVVVLVHPTTSPRHSSEILRWLRWLLPAALLVVAPASAPLSQLDDVITLDADDVASGPLSVADALTRGVERASKDRSGGS
jgi:hypothetical protein